MKFYLIICSLSYVNKMNGKSQRRKNAILNQIRKRFANFYLFFYFPHFNIIRLCVHRTRILYVYSMHHCILLSSSSNHMVQHMICSKEVNLSCNDTTVLFYIHCKIKSKPFAFDFTSSETRKAKNKQNHAFFCLNLFFSLSHFISRTYSFRYIYIYI